MVALPPLLVQALGEFQRVVGAANAQQGFHDEGSELRDYAEANGKSEYDQNNLRRYYSEKLLLIVSEITEAQDELRTGRAVTETWYSGGVIPAHGLLDTDAIDYHGALRKPEGVPSELADAVIRAFDFADEADIDLASAIVEKLAYNATRPFKHGKKF